MCSCFVRLTANRSWYSAALELNPFRRFLPSMMRNTEAKPAVRSDWVDAAKGIGIVLVVYGHLLASSFRAAIAVPARFCELSDSVLYSFHMPLFFFLAGLFVERSYSRRGARAFIGEKLRYLGYPYLVWSILQTGLQCIATRTSDNPVTVADLLLIPIRSHEQFWFLYALFWCYVAYALCKQAGRWGMLLLTLAACAIYFRPIATDYFALIDFSAQLIFFVAGILMSSLLLRAPPAANEILRAVLATVVFLGCALYVFTHLLSPVRLTESEGNYPFPLLGLATLGITATIAIARVSATTAFGRVASLVGQYSMPIFLAHMLVGVAARMLLIRAGIENPWVSVAVPVTLAIVVPITMYKVSFGTGFPFLFAWTRVRAQAGERGSYFA